MQEIPAPEVPGETPLDSNRLVAGPADDDGEHSKIGFQAAEAAVASGG